ncbi:MAG: Fe-S cluster assembly protein SufD [Bacteroidia bacterium]
MNIIDQKISTTQFVINELGKHSGKVGFIPDEALIHAMRYLEDKGIPNAKHEDYKYCNIEGILKKDFKSIDNSYLAISAKEASKYKVVENCINLFVINGSFSAELSDTKNLPLGLRISALADADKNILSKHLANYADVNSDAFIALNTAYISGGVFIHAEKGKSIEKAIHIINLVSSSGSVFQNVRNLVVCENGAQLNLVESFETVDLSGKAFTNYLTEIFVGEQAVVETYRVQKECDHAYQVNTTQVFQQRNSNYTTNTYTFSGALVRNNLNVVIGDVNAEAHLNGLFLAKGTQLVDNHTLVDHQKPNCNSNELYKGIVDHKSTGVFNGKIYVRKDAQKTNAYQSSKNILLSDDATLNTKPQLEIYADDVKCSHGTSTGKIDEEGLFYLRSRGIGEESGRRMLVHAFAEEVVQKIKIDSLREYIETLITESIG